jgi:molybdopterin molybdotransferase
LPCASDHLIGYDQALAALLSHAVPREVEIISLDDADGRWLARPIVAPRDRPTAPLSAMDGYAVRDWDPSGPDDHLRLIGVSYPGAPFESALRPGESVRVTTGATLPIGADRVIVDELVQVGAGVIGLTGCPGRKPHIRPAGSDFHAGEILVPAGLRLTTPTLMAAAAAEADRVSVIRRPRVAIISTGDELVAPGAPAPAHSVPDSVSPGVAALTRQWGGEVVARRRAGDTAGALAAIFDEVSRSCDLVVVIGGASGSERDQARASIFAQGAAAIFQGVALKPGRPAWAARASEGLVIGLPGNPFAAFVAARLLLAPVIAQMAGDAAANALGWREGPLLEPLGPGAQSDLILAADRTPDGLRVHRVQDSSAHRSLARLSALVRRPAHCPASEAFDAAVYLDV